ncbi:hypothetical protein [Brevundimonas lenta]|uniref:Uncharacterized protein n=1 Tax=Brevundimonas lenta TaxID=424796 RepID=A0A7W6JGJ0_9CAUL|nr:hypothetical protein [Brevundimonas lenta]MBB4083682.1 hypothetical protein [Brevundimonas lenta]
MSDFDTFIDAVTAGATTLAKDMLRQGLQEAQEDARTFLKRTEADLRKWTEALALNKLTPREFADLVDGRASLATLAALTQLGVARTRLERFRVGLIELVIDSAFDTFVPG